VRAIVPTVVSLFSGAGGLDVGLEQAGWETVAATDFDRDCVTTLTDSGAARIRIPRGGGRRYLANAEILQADIAGLTADDLRPTGSKRWRPDLLAGGPPCQPWSSAGLQQGFSDPRGQLMHHFIRLIDELRPRFVLMENVRGLVTAIGPNGKPGEALRLIQSSLEEVGYASSVGMLNAADFGAAQRRVRLFLIASSDHRLPEFPEPTHADPEKPTLLNGHRRPWVSLGDLLATLPPPLAEDVVRPAGERGRQIMKLRPGKGLRTSGRVESNRPGGHWGYRQDSFLADPSVPSRTIRAATTPDWIRDDEGKLRRLTWRECAALQGFPEGWRFSGTVASRFRQIGNAVQPMSARAMGYVILESLEQGPLRRPPVSAPWPAEFHRRVRYTAAEHRVNGAHRVRVRAKV
jgi:DNA (cytosine-5)-methyltransferase 1